MSISVAFALAAFCAWCLVYLVIRFIGANLGYGARDHIKVGWAALLGLAAGSLYLAGFVLKWGREEWMTYQWEREWRSFGEYSDVADLTIRWFEEFFAYTYDLHWAAYRAMPVWDTDLWVVVPYLGMALAAFIVISALSRRAKGETVLGPLQDLAIGFFAPVGILPLVGLVFGIVGLIIVTVGLFVAALMFRVTGMPTRRS
jgi:hypothetical protein